jgi:hypothetical protein
MIRNPEAPIAETRILQETRPGLAPEGAFDEANVEPGAVSFQVEAIGAFGLDGDDCGLGILGLEENRTRADIGPGVDDEAGAAGLFHSLRVARETREQRKPRQFVVLILKYLLDNPLVADAVGAEEEFPAFAVDGQHDLLVLDGGHDRRARSML